MLLAWFSVSARFDNQRHGFSNQIDAVPVVDTGLGFQLMGKHKPSHVSV